MAEITLAIYAGLTETPRPYQLELQRRARLLPYTTHRSGGLYGLLEFFLPGDPAHDLGWRGGDRVTARLGDDIVWEGVVATLNLAVRDGERGLHVAAVGAQSLLARRTINRRWADNRLDTAVWQPDNDAPAAERMRDNRRARIRLTPAAEEFLNGEYARLSYTMPTGRTIARVVADAELSETARWSPRQVRNNALTILGNAADGDETSGSAVTITAGQYLYIGSNREFDYVDVVLGATVNATAATLTLEYVVAQAHTWSAVGSLSDGTANSGASLGQNGRITWTRIEDWAPDGLVGSRMFWVRLSWSATLTTNTLLNEIYVGERQQWALRLRDTVGGSNIIQRVSDGSSSHDVTLGTPRQALSLDMLSQAKQTGINNGTIYGEITALTLYDATSGPTVASAAADLLDEADDILNEDASHITANTLALVPFLTDGPEAIAAILDRLTDFGDAAGNAWYWTIRHSERAAAPDGKPVLALAPLPSLSDGGYEYVISLEEPELLPPFELLLDVTAVVNWVVVIYRDAATGLDVILTPDDESSLADSGSIAAYGERHGAPLRLGETSATAALTLGEAYLARYAWPQYSVSGPLRVLGSIRSRGGGRVAAAAIHADGTRLKIENFLDGRRGDAPDAGLIFSIEATSYDPDTAVCEISTGNYDNLAVLVARLGGG